MLAFAHDPRNRAVFELHRLETAGLAAVLVLLVLSLTLHEWAHAFVADRRGDPTPRAEGRLTLNPLAHIDPVLTVLLPALLLHFSDIVFGGARPVRVVPEKLRSPVRDMALVAFAGPLSNFVIAVLLVLVASLLWSTGAFGERDTVFTVLHNAVSLNLLLVVFNLLPLPPLDGSRIVAAALPVEQRRNYDVLGLIGFLALLALLFTGILWGPLESAVSLLWRPASFLGSLGGVL